MTFVELLEKLSSPEAKTIYGKVGTAFLKAAQFGEKITEAYLAYSKWWEEKGAHICQAIYDVVSPLYDEPKKTQLIAHAKAWGRFGYVIPFQNIKTMLAFSPQTVEEADMRMQPQCTVATIINLKNAICNSGSNKEDLDEALFCFEAGKYKACALILFGLIDHELIGMGFEKTYKNQEPRKMLGVSAAKEYLKENNEDYSKKIIFIYLFFLNIMEVLKTLLADGNNFTNEPDMINRNFVSHGMSHRMVSDIDCFRVWLALYGLAVILPQLEETLE